MSFSSFSATRGKPIFAVVMGVSGSGKTTVGIALAEKLNLPFLDADQLHPASNIDKMKAGTPLNDDDRLEWLRILSLKMGMIEANEGPGLVIGCSALKVKYRRILRGFCTGYSPESITENERQVHFLYLKGTFEQLSSRIQERKDHFMPASLLQSQFDTLEEPTEAEGVDSAGQVRGILVTSTIDVSAEEIASKFAQAICAYHEVTNAKRCYLSPPTF